MTTIKGAYTLSEFIGTCHGSSLPLRTSDEVLQGIVINSTKNEFLIQSTEQGMVKIITDVNTIQWEGISWVNEIPVKPGDALISTGKWQNDTGSFLAQKIYINISKTNGRVRKVEPGQDQIKIDDIRSVWIDLGHDSSYLSGGNAHKRDRVC